MGEIATMRCRIKTGVALQALSVRASGKSTPPSGSTVNLRANYAAYPGL